MMKIKNSDKEEMQRLCDFVRENLEALGSFGLIKLFADFCESQIEPKKNETNRER